MNKKIISEISDVELEKFKKVNLARISTIWDMHEKYQKYAREIKKGGTLKTGFPTLDTYLERL